MGVSLAYCPSRSPDSCSTSGVALQNGCGNQRHASTACDASSTDGSCSRTPKVIDLFRQCGLLRYCCLACESPSVPGRTSHKSWTSSACSRQLLLFVDDQLGSETAKTRKGAPPSRELRASNSQQFHLTNSTLVKKTTFYRQGTARHSNQVVNPPDAQERTSFENAGANASDKTEERILHICQHVGLSRDPTRRQESRYPPRCRRPCLVRVRQNTTSATISIKLLELDSTAVETDAKLSIPSETRRNEHLMTVRHHHDVMQRRVARVHGAVIV